MLNQKGERELAYIVTVDNVEPIEGYDKIAFATVGGWHCVVGIDMKAGDKAVYFEIDSLLPSDDERFAFCEKYKYRVKTQRYCKGTRISQGLLLPISDFPELVDKEVGDFVTNILKVTYYDPIDRERKGKNKENQQYNSFFKKVKRYFPFKQMLRTEWGRKILFAIFGVKKKKSEWPSFVPKTDEERWQNMAWIVKDREPWEVTEKVDGSSSTYAIQKLGKKKYKIWVCSRNVVLTRDKGSYYDDNIWFEMYDKYHIEEFLKDYIEKTGADWAYLQGETFGATVQKRDYSLKGRDFRAFILNDSTQKTRLSYAKTKEILDGYDIPTVPILNNSFILPEDPEKFNEIAQDKSEIDGLPREGVVFRKVSDPSKSFKAVDSQFLLNYHN